MGRRVKRETEMGASAPRRTGVSDANGGRERKEKKKKKEKEAKRKEREEGSKEEDEEKPEPVKGTSCAQVSLLEPASPFCVR